MDQSYLSGNGSNVNPLALVILIVACGVMIASSRQNGIKALFLTAAIVPLGQRIMVMGLHLQFYRLLLFVGMCRVIFRGEIREFQCNKIDKFLVTWAFVGVVCGVIRGGSAEVFGLAYNALAVYFLIRSLTKDLEDVLGALRFLALLALLISIPMCYEAITHHNLFSVFGGVPELDDIRDGRARCQGAFLQPIMAGTFGATVFPLAAGLWFMGGRNRRFSVVGAIGALIITVTSVSSGAAMTLAAAFAGLAFWPWRNYMSRFRRIIVVTLIGLALVMKAPVWYLIDRLSDVVGGGGWHRSYLIDQFVSHFVQWCWVGTSYTANWAPDGQVLAVDPNNMDITNHYVQQGVDGGLLKLCLFIAILVQCFKVVGRLVHSESTGLPDRKLAWAFGVTLVAHCAAFISISYFDQTTVFLYWLFAVISCFSSHHLFSKIEDHSIADDTAAFDADSANPEIRWDVPQGDGNLSHQ